MFSSESVVGHIGDLKRWEAGACRVPVYSSPSSPPLVQTRAAGGSDADDGDDTCDDFTVSTEFLAGRSLPHRPSGFSSGDDDFDPNEEFVGPDDGEEAPESSENMVPPSPGRDFIGEVYESAAMLSIDDGGRDEMPALAPPSQSPPPAAAAVANSADSAYSPRPRPIGRGAEAGAVGAGWPALDADTFEAINELGLLSRRLQKLFVQGESRLRGGKGGITGELRSLLTAARVELGQVSREIKCGSKDESLVA